MSFYGSLQNSAERLLKKFGKTVVFKKTVLGVYDPNTGSSTNTETSYSVLCASLPQGLLVRNAFQNDFSGSDVILDNTRLLLVSGKNLPVLIEAGDKFVLDSFDWTVVGVTEVRPSSTSVLYRVGVRR